MMKVVRIIFFAVIMASSYYFLTNLAGYSPATGIALGGGIAGILIALEYFLSRLGVVYFISFLISLFLAFIFTVLINIFVHNLGLSVNFELFNLGSFLTFLYLCFCASLKILRSKFMAGKSLRSEIIIMDTSAIIDGRIADIWATKFLSARLLIPRFVLKELQKIADSQDPLKRARGRRGLDILNRMRKAKIDIVIDDQDFPEIKEVDAKLVQMAKLYNAPVLTTDYNLNKVAELQGVIVLNINDLANALRPVFLPGERLKIRVVKEGKEYNQGVGYLEDGTMVVVEEARHLIGNALDVEVKSVLQTSAGRIIFTRRVNH